MQNKNIIEKENKYSVQSQGRDKIWTLYHQTFNF